MINRVVLNETSYFGRGSRTKLADEIKNRGYQKSKKRDRMGCADKILCIHALYYGKGSPHRF